MSGKHRFPLAAAILLVAPLLGPSVTHAQRGARFSGRVAAPRTSSVRTSGMRPRGIRPRTLAPAGGGGAFFSNTLGNVSFFSPSVPGLNGINYVANQDIGVEAAIDPATQWRLAVAEQVLRNTPGIFPGAGYYLLDGGGAYAIPVEAAQTEQPPAQQPQPQVIVIQQAPAKPAQAEAQPAPAQPAASQPPLPDIGQFTLVLRDGKQLQAVAFTRVKDKIVYITPEGSRRTIAASEIDSDATVRVNEERGTPLQSPL
jgi:hypothetical protein